MFHYEGSHGHGVNGPQHCS